MARKSEGARVAALGERVERGAAGIRKTEQSRGFIERFAGRIVVRTPENVHARCGFDRDELRMAAGDEQRQKRIRR